jgi:hypothetical protein
MVFIPAFGGEAAASASGPVINPGDLLITGSADSSARSWSFEVRTSLCTVTVIRFVWISAKFGTSWVSMGHLLKTKCVDSMVSTKFKVQTGASLKPFILLEMICYALFRPEPLWSCSDCWDWSAVMHCSDRNLSEAVQTAGTNLIITVQTRTSLKLFRQLGLIWLCTVQTGTSLKLFRLLGLTWL